jgi:hypothetical protein
VSQPNLGPKDFSNNYFTPFGLALRWLSLRWLMSALREENAILTPSPLGEKLM